MHLTRHNIYHLMSFLLNTILLLQFLPISPTSKVIPNVIERAREFYFSPARPRYEHMAVDSEGGMSLHLRGVSKVQASGPFYLSIVQPIIQVLSSVRSIGYYENLWVDKLCPFFNHSLSSPFSICFLKPRSYHHTPYRRLNSPVAGAHSENFFSPSGVPSSASGDSCQPRLDAILSLWGRAFGQLKGWSCVPPMATFAS